MQFQIIVLPLYCRLRQTYLKIKDMKKVIAVMYSYTTYNNKNVVADYIYSYDVNSKLNWNAIEAKIKSELGDSIETGSFKLFF